MWLIPPPPAISVFAVGTDTAQIVWRKSTGSNVRVHIDGPNGSTHEQEVIGGSPGALVASGLTPHSAYTATIEGCGKPVVLDFTTLAPPPGEELFKIATMNDLHLGNDHFGVASRMVERPRNPVITSYRCAEAAVDEALAWGAQRIVLKGDLVHYGDPHEWELLGQLLDRINVPVMVVPGNHESRHGLTKKSAKALADLGHPQDNPANQVDLPGLRVVAIDSTVRGEHIGRVGHVHDQLMTAAEGQLPVLVLHHHNLQTTPFPTVYPRGAYGRNVRRLLKGMAKRNPNVMFASGHTHRHRERSRYGIKLMELGSTKDYPGTWAGYTVHAGGIRQEVRRIARPDVISWTEYTAQAVCGAWSHWSPGTLSDRCMVETWTPTRRVS